MVIVMTLDHNPWAMHRQLSDEYSLCLNLLKLNITSQFLSNFAVIFFNHFQCVLFFFFVFADSNIYDL